MFLFQRGSALYIAAIMITILLALAMAMSAILVSELKITNNLENSVMALFAAQSGIERGAYEGKCPSCYTDKCPSCEQSFLCCAETPECCESPYFCEPYIHRYTDYLDVDKKIAYEVKVVACNPEYPGCTYDFNWFDLGCDDSRKLVPDPDGECFAETFCVYSTGIYKDTRRTLKIAF